MSQNEIPENERGFSKSMVTNKWEQRLGALDKAVLNYLLADVLEWYGYPHHRREGIPVAVMIALAVLVPTGYERRHLSPGYLIKALAKGKFKTFVGVFYHSLCRVAWFYKLFYRRNFGTFYKAPVIGGA